MCCVICASLEAVTLIVHTLCTLSLTSRAELLSPSTGSRMNSRHQLYQSVCWCSDANSLLVFMETAIGVSSPLWCTKHLTDTSFNRPDCTISVLMTRVVPSPWGRCVATGAPMVRLSLSTFHTISAGGRDTEVQLASITPGEVVL